MDHLYEIGETACNGVHGKNRLASNSLLESLVFAKRAAKEIASAYEMLHNPMVFAHIQEADYTNMASLKQTYRHMVQAEVMV